MDILGIGGRRSEVMSSMKFVVVQLYFAVIKSLFDIYIYNICYLNSSFKTVFWKNKEIFKYFYIESTYQYNIFELN